jgi:acid phosphatase
MSRMVVTVVATLPMVLLPGASSSAASSTATASVTAPIPSSAAPPAAKATANPRVTKVLVFVEENHSLRQMKREMPYTFRLAQRYGYATRYTAIRHPSLPNYLAIAGGSTFGVRDDAAPAVHRLRGRSVFGSALRSGRTAAIYADGMPHRCALEPGGTHYAVKHNPWAYFVDERRACRRHDVPAHRLAEDVAAGALPNVGMVIPNLCHDAHDCPLASADRWFRRQMRTIFSGPDWRSGHLAVVLTADEDDRSQGNRVLTAVIHPGQHHHVVRSRLTHYSLSRMLSRVGDSRPLRNARSAPSMAKAFGLRL